MLINGYEIKKMKDGRYIIYDVSGKILPRIMLKDNFKLWLKKESK